MNKNQRLKAHRFLRHVRHAQMRALIRIALMGFTETIRKDTNRTRTTRAGSKALGMYG